MTVDCSHPNFYHHNNNTINFSKYHNKQSNIVASSPPKCHPSKNAKITSMKKKWSWKLKQHDNYHSTKIISNITNDCIKHNLSQSQTTHQSASQTPNLIHKLKISLQINITNQTTKLRVH